MIRINQEKSNTILLCLALCFGTVKTGLITAIRLVVELPYKIDTILVYIFLLVLIACSIRYILQRISIKDLLFVLTILALYFLSWLSTDGYENYFLTVLAEFGMCICVFLLTRTNFNLQLLISYLRVFSFLILFSSVVVFFGGIEEDYSQYFGYSILPAAVISCNALFDISQKNRFVFLIVYLASTFLCLMSGARGPLAFSILSLLLEIVLHPSKNIALKILSVMLLSAVFLLFTLNSERVLLAIREYAIEMNFSTRSLDLLLEGEFATDTPRQKIMKASFSCLNSSARNQMIGVGIGVDRIRIAQKMMAPINETIGYYPHNIFVEFLLQYGYFVGGLLSFSLVYLIIRVFLQDRNKDESNRILIFFVIGFLPFLVSGSYLTTTTFPLFLGMFLNKSEGRYFPKE